MDKHTDTLLKRYSLRLRSQRKKKPIAQENGDQYVQANSQWLSLFSRLHTLEAALSEGPVDQVFLDAYDAKAPHNISVEVEWLESLRNSMQVSAFVEDDGSLHQLAIFQIFARLGNPFQVFANQFIKNFDFSFAPNDVRRGHEAVLQSATKLIRSFTNDVSTCLNAIFPAMIQSSTAIAVQEFIFTHIFPSLFGLYKRKNFYRDAEFSSKLMALQEISTAELGIDPQFCLTESRPLTVPQRQDRVDTQTPVYDSDSEATNILFEHPSRSFIAKSQLAGIHSDCSPCPTQRSAGTVTPRTTNGSASLHSSPSKPIRARTVSHLTGAGYMSDLDINGSPKTTFAKLEAPRSKDLHEVLIQSERAEKLAQVLRRHSPSRPTFVGLEHRQVRSHSVGSAVQRPVQLGHETMAAKKTSSLISAEKTKEQNGCHRDGEQTATQRSYPYKLAVLGFRKLSDLTTPQTKLGCVVDVSHRLCQCVDEYYKSRGEEPPGLCINADDLLAIFAYVLLRSRLPHVLSEAQFMQEWVSDRSNLAMSGYFLAVLRAAIELISNLDTTEKGKGTSDADKPTQSTPVATPRNVQSLSTPTRLSQSASTGDTEGVISARGSNALPIDSSANLPRTEMCSPVSERNKPSTSGLSRKRRHKKRPQMTENDTKSTATLIPFFPASLIALQAPGSYF